jgi:hypothetical protein
MKQGANKERWQRAAMGSAFIALLPKIFIEATNEWL